MANVQNLISVEELNSRRTPEKHSEDSKKGGIASGEARRKKKRPLSLSKRSKKNWTKL